MEKILRNIIIIRIVNAFIVAGALILIFVGPGGCLSTTFQFQSITNCQNIGINNWNFSSETAILHIITIVLVLIAIFSSLCSTIFIKHLSSKLKSITIFFCLFAFSFATTMEALIFFVFDDSNNFYYTDYTFTLKIYGYLGASIMFLLATLLTGYEQNLMRKYLLNLNCCNH